MTVDEKIQIWIAVGTWFAGFSTLTAAIVALRLAKRIEKVKLRVYVGLRELIRGDGSPSEEHLCINVTNLGERPVTVHSTSWAIGKGKHRRFAIQTVSGVHSSKYPLELAYGKEASFMVSFRITPNWPRDFATDFVRDLSDGNLKTLVAQINTSVGQTIEVKPEPPLIDKLKGYR